MYNYIYVHSLNILLYFVHTVVNTQIAQVFRGNTHWITTGISGW